MIGARDLAELLVVTYRQLDYWARQLGIQQAKGTGNRRSFTADEVADLASVAALVHAGFTATHAVDVAKARRCARLGAL